MAKAQTFKTAFPLWVVRDFAGNPFAAYLGEAWARSEAKYEKGRTVTLCHAVFTRHQVSKLPKPAAKGKRAGKAKPAGKARR